MNWRILEYADDSMKRKRGVNAWPKINCVCCGHWVERQKSCQPLGKRRSSVRSRAQTVAYVLRQMLRRLKFCDSELQVRDEVVLFAVLLFQSLYFLLEDSNVHLSTLTAIACSLTIPLKPSFGLGLDLHRSHLLELYLSAPAAGWLVSGRQHASRVDDLKAATGGFWPLFLGGLPLRWTCDQPTTIWNAPNHMAQHTFGLLPGLFAGALPAGARCDTVLIFGVRLAWAAGAVVDGPL